MRYIELVKTYTQLEKEPGKLKKVEILSELFSKTPEEVLEKVVTLSMGRVFPAYSDKKTGVATQMMIKIISKTTGLSEKDVVNKLKNLGDLGIVAEKCMEAKRQASLFTRNLTVDDVVTNVEKLSDLVGKGSQEKKIGLISNLLSSSKPEEAKYLIKTVIETFRIGVAEGIVRDAIAKSFGVNPTLVENAWFLRPNYGEIAVVAKKGGNEALERIEMEPGKPIVVMLGEKEPSIEEAIDKYEDAGAEWKFDGVRLQIHKKDGKIWLFTRRLENVTGQFPEIAEYAKSLNAKSCIIEGECIATDKEGNPLPFQKLSRRVQRKYDIKEMTRKVPVRVYLFDIVYLNSKPLMGEIFSKRREKLEKVVKPIPKKFEIVEQLRTKDLKKVREFYKKSLESKQEGLMIKNMAAKYQPGRRVGSWIKIKPVLEPLDLVITGAEWGKGKRSKWLSSVELSCRDADSGEFLECGKLGTGLTDEQFGDLTRKLKKLIVKEDGVNVKVKPEIVVEVGYEEIQKSPKYGSGFALRFPRLLRFRESDKKAVDADTLERVESIFKQQFSDV
ncbi:hypothetical protein A3K63_00330 [Candidatus Micrarchaeota archaeon RBG_16_49_10]|nr:MAG: hypothetical protein A3K63_00330 [Candidatus Micrarchaeota archaeon RBG_16_49_10]